MSIENTFYSGHMTYDQSDNVENYYALNHLCIESLNVCNKQIMHLKQKTMHDNFYTNTTKQYLLQLSLGTDSDVEYE